jgi:hypothetical protein
MGLVTDGIAIETHRNSKCICAPPVYDKLGVIVPIPGTNALHGAGRTEQNAHRSVPEPGAIPSLVALQACTSGCICADAGAKHVQQQRSSPSSSPVQFT